MSEEYTKMWDELGLDIEAHDGLLTVLKPLKDTAATLIRSLRRLNC
jgi:hypothetical protein